MSLVGSGLALWLSSRREAPGATETSRALARLADETEVRLNGGRGAHAAFAWSLLAIGLATTAALAGAVLFAGSWVVSGLLSVYLLWLALAWRPTAEAFERIRWALAEGRLDLARELLADWPASAGGGAGLPVAPGDTSAADYAAEPTAIADAAIERAAADLLRGVYSPLFWFALLPGGSGAVLCRVAEAVAQRWSQAPEPAIRDTFGQWAVFAREAVESIPARVSSALAALLGDAASTAEAWRATPASGLLGPLAEARRLAGACALGALGVPAQGPVVDERDACAQATARMESARRLQRRVLAGWLALMLLPALVS